MYVHWLPASPCVILGTERRVSLASTDLGRVEEMGMGILGKLGRRAEVKLGHEVMLEPNLCPQVARSWLLWLLQPCPGEGEKLPLPLDSVAAIPKLAQDTVQAKTACPFH